MELYLLKSTLCLALLLAFYKIVLENTSMHHFKRFYLLGSVLATLIIPTISFTTYVEVSQIVSFDATSTEEVLLYESEAVTNYWPFLIWTIYAIGVSFFSLKFFRSIYFLIQKIRQNLKHKENRFVYVLLEEAIIPHTFFRYIFLNKKQFEANEIPVEVMLHEEAHASQRHSLDIIFIEMLKIIFWFNPLFYFLKRSIKLNHEFLADQAVLKLDIETSAYQNLLLAFCNTNYKKDTITPSLANSINYSSMKKRFTIMKTNTSRRGILFRSFLILPLLSFLIYGFSTTEMIERNIHITYVSVNDTIKNIKIKIDENSNIFLNGKFVNISNLREEVNKLNTHLSEDQKQKYLFANIEAENEKLKDLAKEVGRILYTCNIKSVNIVNLKGLRDAGLKDIPQNNPMAGKTVEEAEVIHQQKLKELEEYKKQQTEVKHNKNNPWSVQVGESKTGNLFNQKIDATIPMPETPSFHSNAKVVLSDGSIVHIYEDMVITPEKATDLLLDKEQDLYTLAKQEDGRQIFMFSRSPIKGGKIFVLPAKEIIEKQ